MHPRSIYKDNPPDFKELAIKYPYFRQYCRENTSGAVIIDFKDPAALRALTCALLENDFDLKIEIPLDRLIPTVPLRLNYILWVEDLVRCLPGRDTQTDVIGVDIGTGSSCIYPLLGAKLNDWKFLATEVDESSLKYAENNIKRNGLTDKITVQQVSPGSYLHKPLTDANHQQVTFCMCNPPFFSSEDEAAFGSARTDKRPLPVSINTGSTTETVTSGGEVEFVKQIIDDSLQLQEKVSWYTTMVGKKTSMKSVLAYLREKKVSTVTTTTFNQGKTMRWGVAWTLLKNIPVDAVSPPLVKRPRKQNKPLSFVVPDDCAELECDDGDPIFEQVVKLIKVILMDLKIVIEENQSREEVCSYRCSASQITWTHQRKKRRQLQRLERLGNTTSLDKNKLKDEDNCEMKTGDTKSTQNGIERVCSSGTSDGKKTAFENNKHNGNPSESIKSTDNGSSNQRTLSGNLWGLDEQADKEERNTLQSDDIDSSDAVKASLCSFWVRLLRTTTELKEQTVVQVECVQANNKNDVYQLYQYLQNKILKAK